MGIAQLSRDTLQNGASHRCACVKLSARGGGVSHHFGGAQTSLRKDRAIWGITAIISQYRAIWGHYAPGTTCRARRRMHDGPHKTFKEESYLDTTHRLSGADVTPPPRCAPGCSYTPVATLSAVASVQQGCVAATRPTKNGPIAHRPVHHVAIMSSHRCRQFGPPKPSGERQRGVQISVPFLGGGGCKASF